MTIGLAVFVSACETCPYRSVSTFGNPPDSVGCCDAKVAVTFTNGFDDADVDIAVSETVGAPTQVDAWLTAGTCDRLFDSGSNTPNCDILIGPVAAGSVSPRREAPTGSLRIWVRLRNAVETPVPYRVDATLWRHQCRPGLG